MINVPHLIAASYETRYIYTTVPDGCLAYDRWFG